MNWTTIPETIFWIWHLIMSSRLNSRWTSSSRSYNSGWKLAVFVHGSRERSCLHPLRKPRKIIMARIINCTQNTEHTHTLSLAISTWTWTTRFIVRLSGIEARPINKQRKSRAKRLQQYSPGFLGFIPVSGGLFLYV